MPSELSGVRMAFLGHARAQLGKPCLWGAKGIGMDQPEAFDCSGLVTHCLWRCGAPDMRAMWNAQRLYDDSPMLPVDGFQPGDLGFYGSASGGIIHVVIMLGFGMGVLSASGATPRITRLEDARRAGADVRIHAKAKYRPDFIAVHANKWLSDLEVPRGSKQNTP